MSYEFHILIFIISFGLLYYSSSVLVNSLIKISKFLRVKEFVLAFFTASIAASLPNFFVGISSALYNIPLLSLSDVIGGNVVDLTFVIGITLLLSKKEISTQSRTVQTTAIFTFITALLLFILILDKNLSRADGLILILTFFIYSFWLFSKKERFSKIYEKQEEVSIRDFIKHLLRILFSFSIMAISSQGIVSSASFFTRYLPLEIIGIFLIGFVNSLPELIFCLQTVKKQETWLVLGDIMGAVIVPPTLILGTVSLIREIQIPILSPFIIGRIFLLFVSLLFFIFIKTDRKLTVKEGKFLFFLFFVFIIAEIIFNF